MQMMEQHSDESNEWSTPETAKFLAEVTDDRVNRMVHHLEQLEETLKKALDPELLRKTLLEPYVECIEKVSGGDENAIATQAKMCRSLHIMRILEKQLAYSHKQCKALVRSVQSDFSNQREEDVHIKLELLNQLVHDLEVKQEVEEKYKAILHKQEHMLRKLERKSAAIAESEHSRISADHVALLSCSPDRFAEEDDCLKAKSFGEEDDCPNVALEQSAKSLTLEDVNWWTEEYNSSTDLEVLNAISSDSSELFESDVSSDEGSFQSPEEADMSSPYPWRKPFSFIEMGTEGFGEIEENARDVSTRSSPRKDKADSFTLNGQKKNDGGVHALKGDEPRGPVDEAIEDAKTPSTTTLSSETDSSSSSDSSQEQEKAQSQTEALKKETKMPILPSETDNVCSSDISLALEKAQTLAEALKRKSREGWEIDRHGKSRKPSITLTETKRPSLERRLSSQSVLSALEKQSWGAPPTKPKRIQRRYMHAILTGEKNRPMLPRGLSSQGLLLHIEKQNWGSTKIKQADLYFDQLERPAEFRLVSSKGLMKAKKNRPIETAARKE